MPPPCFLTKTNNFLLSSSYPHFQQPFVEKVSTWQMFLSVQFSQSCIEIVFKRSCSSSFFSSLIALRVHNSKLLLHAGLFSFLCHNSSNKMVPCNHKGWTCGRWSPPGGKTAVQANPNLINIIFWFFSKRDLDMKKKRLEWNVLDSQYQSSWHTGSSSTKSSSIAKMVKNEWQV